MGAASMGMFGRRLNVRELVSRICTRALLLWLLLVPEFGFGLGVGVKLEVKDKHVIMDNGLARVTLSKPSGMVTGVVYNGMELLQWRNKEDNRGYWDFSWNEPGRKGFVDKTEGTEFRIILQNETQVEISFTRTWNSSHNGSLPLNIDKRFIMLEGSHGFYTYSIFEHLKGWPDLNLNLTRLVYKLDEKIFHYMAVDDKRRRHMPLPEDRGSQRCKKLAYPEAVHLVKPIEPEFTGQVDDKYQYSAKVEDIKVHGWVSNNEANRQRLVGFWQITPSYEYRAGGPFKQELTSHVGPTSLTVLFSGHYTGQGIIPKFRNGEAWKKVYGPIFIYLNSGRNGTHQHTLWKNAKNQMKIETQKWPYSFTVSDDYPKSAQRGSVRGRLLVRDRYMSKEDIAAGFAYVGLALPGKAGSWQTESKGYQFWTRASANGSFVINNVRAGIYNLYATVPGFIGDYKSNISITITPGSNINLGDFVYAPPRDAPTLWEIGYPDRSAAEFFIPDPDSRYVSSLFVNHDRFRQYGLWEQYNIVYPNEDLVYDVNSSDYRKDWFYAHMPRKGKANKHEATTWQIRFKLNNVGPNGIYRLRVALASASRAELQVRFNDRNKKRPHFTTRLIGQDNAVARHGIHGLYYLYNIYVKSTWLVEGNNTIFLTQARHINPFQAIMYDYIRFEGLSSGVRLAPKSE